MLGNQLRCREAKVGASRISTRLSHARVQLRCKVRSRDVLRWTDVQQLVQRATRVIRHENLHLSFGKILDVLIQGARLPVFTLDRAVGWLVLLVAE